MATIWNADEPHKWGMAIDLDRCTGCGDCVIACHAENNLPIAGEDETRAGRSYNWIRIDRYYEGEYPELKVKFIPVLCQHCDNAPCEPVCPVFATYHTPEGLNGMVYNRCVGTKFCQNNCPYSVRFFNWEEPALHWPEPLTYQLNPDVTVRSRGVMEKCSFCVQRIRGSEETAMVENRKLKDGDVQPACAQTCSAEAIVFGDLNNPESRVSQLWKSPRLQRYLEELGTEPRVGYLAGEG